MIGCLITNMIGRIVMASPIIRIHAYFVFTTRTFGLFKTAFNASVVSVFNTGIAHVHFVSASAAVFAKMLFVFGILYTKSFVTIAVSLTAFLTKTTVLALFYFIETGVAVFTEMSFEIGVGDTVFTAVTAIFFCCFTAAFQTKTAFIALFDSVPEKADVTVFAFLTTVYAVLTAVLTGIVTALFTLGTVLEIFEGTVKTVMAILTYIFHVVAIYLTINGAAFVTTVHFGIVAAFEAVIAAACAPTVNVGIFRNMNTTVRTVAAFGFTALGTHPKTIGVMTVFTFLQSVTFIASFTPRAVRLSFGNTAHYTDGQLVTAGFADLASAISALITVGFYIALQCIALKTTAAVVADINVRFALSTFITMVLLPAAAVKLFGAMRRTATAVTKSVLILKSFATVLTGRIVVPLFMPVGM